MSENHPVILADTWYAAHIPRARRLADLVPERLRFLTEKSALARGLAILILGRHAELVVTTHGAPGAKVCIIAYGLFKHRKLVLINYLFWETRLLKRPLFRAQQWLLGRALLQAQVCTEHEAHVFGKTLPSGRIQVVPWPSTLDESPDRVVNGGRRVLASGRRTDWKTFFSAAAGTDWEVRAVCTAADLAEVQRLATAGTTIRHDINGDEHQAEVDCATVYVIPVPETGGSIGQIRVMNATQAGVPMVASNVIGLHEYLDESCAVLVPSGDHYALRNAVNALLDNPKRREDLRNAARQRGTTMRNYLDRINSIVEAAIEEIRLGPSS